MEFVANVYCLLPFGLRCWFLGATVQLKAPPFLGHPFPGSVFGIFLQNRTKIHGMQHSTSTPRNDPHSYFHWRFR
jgi:hypothetical protein